VSAGRHPRLSRRVLAPVVLLAMTGCTSLLGLGGGPPPHLYRLTAVAAFPPDLTHVPTQLLVEVPQAPAGLDTRRIALSRSALSLDYYADSEWIDPLPNLIRTALVDSFENSRAITALGRAAIGLRADFALRSEIRHFEAEYRAAGGAPAVSAVILVELVRVPAGEIVATRTFTATQPAAANTIPAVVTAFDAALAKVLQQIVVWTLTNPALSPAHR
jgi:cholesterol transport system auxiliary component